VLKEIKTSIFLAVLIVISLVGILFGITFVWDGIWEGLAVVPHYPMFLRLFDIFFGSCILYFSIKLLRYVKRKTF
jgi:hypothetical protein